MLATRLCNFPRRIHCFCSTRTSYYMGVLVANILDWITKIVEAFTFLVHFERAWRLLLEACLLILSGLLVYSAIYLLRLLLWRPHIWLEWSLNLWLKLYGLDVHILFINVWVIRVKLRVLCFLSHTQVLKCTIKCCIRLLNNLELPGLVRGLSRLDCSAVLICVIDDILIEESEVVRVFRFGLSARLNV